MPPDLEGLSAALTADESVEAAFVFGSVARGTARPDSDLDLALRFTADADPERLKRDQLTMLGRLVLAARAEVHVCDLDHASPALVHAVLRDGKCLLDRNPHRTNALLYAGLEAHVDNDWIRRALDARLAAQLGPENG